MDLKELTIEELAGRFHTAEEGYDLDDANDGTGKLLLTEDEWESHAHQRGQSAS
jgi:hypothetical protein